MKTKILVLIIVVLTAMPMVDLIAQVVPAYINTAILISDTTGRTMDMVPTPDGGVVVCGFFEGNQDMDPSAGTAMVSSNGHWFDAWLAKYDSSGAYQWGHSWGDIGEDIANSLAVDEVGNIHIIGSFNGTLDIDPGSGTFNVTSSTPARDLFWVKLDPNGQFLIGGSILSDGDIPISGWIDADQNGHIYVGGRSRGTTDLELGSGVTTVSAINPNTMFEVNPSFIAKYDLNGSKIWGYPMGGFLKAIEVEPGGANIYIATFGLEVTGTATDYDPGAPQLHPLSSGMLGTEYMAILKYDSNAVPVWHDFIRGTMVGDPVSENEPFDLAIDSALNVIMCGHFISDFILYPGNVVSLAAAGTDWDGFALKYSATGSLIWQKRFGSANVDDIARELMVDDQNNVWVAGTFQGMAAEMNSSGPSVTYNSTGNRDIFVCAFNSAGGYLWSGTAGGSSYDGGPELAVNGNELILAGFFSGTADLNLSPSVSNYSELGGAEVFMSRYALTFLSSVSDDIEEVADFPVWPNPTKSTINVYKDAKLFGSGYYVYDITGQAVLSGRIEKENTIIDLGNLLDGIYLIRFGETAQRSFKVIKK